MKAIFDDPAGAADMIDRYVTAFTTRTSPVYKDLDLIRGAAKQIAQEFGQGYAQTFVKKLKLLHLKGEILEHSPT